MQNSFPAKVGLDIDGTITAAPEFFSRLSRYVLARGGEVHIVSSRSPEAYGETAEELERYGVRWTAIYLLPSIEVAQALCPFSALDWYSRYLWLKVKYAQENELDCFVDDDAKVVKLFQRFYPEICVLLAGTPIDEMEKHFFDSDFPARSI